MHNHYNCNKSTPCDVFLQDVVEIIGCVLQGIFGRANHSQIPFQPEQWSANVPYSDPVSRNHITREAVENNLNNIVNMDTPNINISTWSFFSDIN